MKIKQIGADTKLTPEQVKMKENIQSALASQLQELSVTFRSSQKAYLKSMFDFIMYKDSTVLAQLSLSHSIRFEIKRKERGIL